MNSTKTAWTKTLVAAALGLAAHALGGCGSDGGGGGNTSSSSGTTCSSQSQSQESYVCVGDRCKCASSSGDAYPYTREEAAKSCGGSSSGGNCPSGSSGSSGSSGGGSSGSSGGDFPED